MNFVVILETFVFALIALGINLASQVKQDNQIHKLLEKVESMELKLAAISKNVGDLKKETLKSLDDLETRQESVRRSVAEMYIKVHSNWDPNIIVTESEKTKCNTDPCWTVGLAEHANPGWDTTYTMEVKDRDYPYKKRGVFKYTEHQDDASVRKCDHVRLLTGSDGTWVNISSEGKVSSVPGTRTTTETITNSESHVPVQVIEHGCSLNSIPCWDGLVTY